MSDIALGLLQQYSWVVAGLALAYGSYRVGVDTGYELGLKTGYNEMNKFFSEYLQAKLLRTEDRMPRQ